MWAGVVRYGAFPVLAIAPGLLALWALAADPTGQDAVRDGLHDLVVYSTFIVVTYASVAWLERRLPYRGEWNRPHADVRADAAHLFLTGPVSSQLGLAIAGGLAVLASRWLADPFGFRLWPTAWPVGLQVILAIVLAEFGHYWFHRLSHESELVWRLHAVHHSAPRLYWLNATRFHPGDLIALTFCQSLPLLLLGIPTRTFLIYAVVAGCYGQLQHCNIDVRTGPLRWIWSTPELHRWHHSTDPREGNTNYGAIVSLWDVVFGTLFWPAGRRFGGPVGVHGMPDFPPTYLGQLLAPFRWRALAARNALTGR